MGQHHLPTEYPLQSAQKGQRYFYTPGQCWVRSVNGYQIELCDWSPLPDYGDEECVGDGPCECACTACLSDDHCDRASCAQPA